LSVLYKIDKTNTMHTITASTARQTFSQLMETAQSAPVVIQRQKRDIAVVMSAAEYQCLVHLNVAEFQRFSDQVGRKAQAAGMNESALQELLSCAD